MVIRLVMKWQRQSVYSNNLPDNGDEGTKAIGEASKVNTSLTHIDLCENNIGDEGKGRGRTCKWLD